MFDPRADGSRTSEGVGSMIARLQSIAVHHNQPALCGVAGVPVNQDGRSATRGWDLNELGSAQGDLAASNMSFMTTPADHEANLLPVMNNLLPLSRPIGFWIGQTLGKGSSNHDALIVKRRI